MINSPPCTSPPPAPSKCRNGPTHQNCIVEIGRRHGQDCGEEEHDANEEYPRYGNPIQRLLKPAKHIWPGAEFYARGVDVAGHNYGSIGEVETGCGYVKDGDYGLGGPDTDAVEEYAK